MRASLCGGMLGWEQRLHHGGRTSSFPAKLTLRKQWPGPNANCPASQNFASSTLNLIRSKATVAGIASAKISFVLSWADKGSPSRW